MAPPARHGEQAGKNYPPAIQRLVSLQSFFLETLLLTAIRGAGLSKDIASFHIHKVHKFAGEAGHRKVAVVISRFLFGWIALNAKAGVRAAVKDCNHFVDLTRTVGNRSL